MTQFYSGIDIGSTMTKVVIADNEGAITTSVISATGPEHRKLANRRHGGSIIQCRATFG